MNIILNAADSLVEAETKETENLEKVLTILSLNANGTMELRFEDNGSGISEEELAQIFDPFYTTKASNLGLGLTMARRQFRLHGGDVVLTRNEGGCTFQVTLQSQS